MVSSYHTERKEKDIKERRPSNAKTKKLRYCFLTETYKSYIRINIIQFGFANWLLLSVEFFLSARLIFFSAQRKKMKFLA